MVGPCLDQDVDCSQRTYNAEVDLYNELADAKKAVPGAKTSTPVVVERRVDPARIARVFLLENGELGEPVEMTKRPPSP